MKTTYSTSAKLRRTTVLLAAFFATPLSILAQAVSSPSTNSANEEEEDVVYLSPFIVSEAEDVGYSSQQTMVGSRTAEKILDLPSSVAIMNEELINDLNAVDVQQTLDIGVSGVTSNQTINDDFNIRGFRTMFSLRNNITKSTFKRNPMYDVSRVEVLKGPAALMLGNNSFLGGAVNFLSIRPTADPSGYLKATLSDDSYVRLEANVSGPALKTDEFVMNYRLTAGGLSANRDKEISDKDDELFLGGGFEMFFGDNTSLRLNAFWFQDDTYRYWDDFLDISGAPASEDNLKLAKLNQYSTKSFSPGRSKDAFWKNQDVFIDLTFLTKLTESLNLRAFYSHSNLIDRRRHVRGITVDADNYTLNRQDIPLAIDNSVDSVQIDMIYDWEAEHFTLNSTFGVDRSWGKSTQELSVNAAPPLDTRTGEFPDDDEYFAQELPGAGLPNAISSGNNTTLLSYYVQENLGLFDDRLILVAGIRGFEPGGTNTAGDGSVSCRSSTKFSTTKFGLVWKIQPWLSAFYTNATNVFVAPNGNTDRDEANDQLGEPFKDQDGTLDEIGIKFDHRISDELNLYGSLVYFDMALTNVRTFGDLGNGNDGIIQSAQDESSGFEFDFGLRYSMSNGDLDLIVTYFNGDSNTARNPGLQAANFVPQQFSTLVKYSWRDGMLKGFGLGGSMMVQDDKRNGFYIIETPTIFNVFASYSMNEHWDFQLNLDDLTDERYIVARAADGLIQTSNGFRARLAVTYRW